MIPDITFVGLRDPDGYARVVVDGRPFSARQSLAVRSHSPDGFEWGYGGSGPAQLALALLLEALDDDDRAQRLYQDFKWGVVAFWPHAGFTVTDRWIRGWCDGYEVAGDQPDAIVEGGAQ